MPRIRKQTSKRGTTHQRQKIKQKVRETHKKSKKEAKRNPQWKTKHPKDPGIPNNFPYKDQILAEVAEQRRKAEEEKAKRKEAKKSARAQAKAPKHTGVNADAAEDASDDEDTGADAVGIDDISGRVVNAPSLSKAKVATIQAMEEDEAAPALMNPALSHLGSVLDAADIVIQVLDVRDPLATRSTSLDDAVSDKGKKALYVLNKIDCCPREAVSTWSARLREQHPTFIFRSASRFLPSPNHMSQPAKGKEPADDALGLQAIVTFLSKYAAEKSAGESLVVAVVGVTNTGKSSFINSLAGKAASQVYQLPSLSAPSHSPTTTPYPIEVSIDVDGHSIRFIDTPGLSFVVAPDATSEEAEGTRAADILLRSKGRIDRLKDPVAPLTQIVSRANAEDLMLFYNLPAFTAGDADAFLRTLARIERLTKKGGALDVTAAARLVLRDWSTGKLPRYALPPKADVHSALDIPAPANATDIYGNDENVLAQIPSRAERRRATGVVRMAAAARETRRVDLAAPWAGVNADADADESMDVDPQNSAEADEDAVGEEGQDDEDEDDPEDQDDEDQEDGSEEGDEADEAVVLAPASGKRKRSVTLAVAPSAKKVVFAASRSSKAFSKSSAPATIGSVLPPRASAPPKSALKARPSRVTVKPKLSVADARKVRRQVPTKTEAKGKPAKAKVQAADAGKGAGMYDFKEFF